MIINHPFIITPRLLPGIAIADGWLSFDGKHFILDTSEFREYRMVWGEHTEITAHKFYSAVSSLRYAAAIVRLLDGDVDMALTGRLSHLSKCLVEWCYKHRFSMVDMDNLLQKSLRDNDPESLIQL